MTVISEGGKASGARGLATWLAGIAPRSAHGMVTVAILPDKKIKALNRRFRGVDKTTDVLSFAEKGSGVISRSAGRTRRPPPFLGEIAISSGIAQKQADLYGHSLQAEVRVLALHGLLHLLGYDHESDSGRMARAEARLRRKAGLPPGLIGRSERLRGPRVRQ